jgi:hypothetical protein
MTNFPINFIERFSTKANLQISADDLMTALIYAATDAPPMIGSVANRIEVSTGTGELGKTQRSFFVRSELPDIPNNGTYVLGAKDGALTWLATEEC